MCLSFGAQYQLTVNDMRNLKYRILTIPVGIFTQLFKLPVTTNEFPFFDYQYSTITFFGYYYVEAFVCGLFVLNPICIIIFFIKGLKNVVKEKEAYKLTSIIILVSVLICVVNIVLAGTLQRYSMDYAWLLNIASFLIVFMIANNLNSLCIKKYLLKITLTLTLYMFFINFIVGAVVSESNFLERLYPNEYYAIRYSICFWE